jgi:purine-binding chemotaxis protein CheW
MARNDSKKQLEKELVLFELGKEIYGVDISVVIEIIRMQPITKVPKAPVFVEGVINLRGKVIPIVDMRKRFGLPKAEQNKDNRIMVLDSGGQNVGIIIDAVTEVLRIPSDSVEPPSDIIVSAASDYLLGITKHDKNMIILLDMDRVLAKDGVSATSISRDLEQKDVKESEEIAVA